MDIIGKIYSDYLISNYKLDGQSYLLENQIFGGCCNLFDDEFWFSELKQYINLNYFLICNKNMIGYLEKKYEKIKIEYIYTNEQTPTAFIFDKEGKRTSFVINDKYLKIENYQTKSNIACIFYGDKIYSEIFPKYEKVFIDTAGNNKKDLENLLKSSLLKKNNILSISNEYVDDIFINKFINNTQSTLILHSPKESSILSYREKIKISNSFYIPHLNNSKNLKVTGLGDKFFLLIAIHNIYLNLNLEESIIKSQELISKFISKFLN